MLICERDSSGALQVHEPDEEYFARLRALDTGARYKVFGPTLDMYMAILLQQAGLVDLLEVQDGVAERLREAIQHVDRVVGWDPATRMEICGVVDDPAAFVAGLKDDRRFSKFRARLVQRIIGRTGGQVRFSASRPQRRDINHRGNVQFVPAT